MGDPIVLGGDHRGAPLKAADIIAPGCSGMEWKGELSQMMVPHAASRFAVRGSVLLLLLLLGSGLCLAIHPVVSFTVPPVAADGVEFAVMIEVSGLESGETLPITVTFEPEGKELQQALLAGSNRLTMSTSSRPTREPSSAKHPMLEAPNHVETQANGPCLYYRVGGDRPSCSDQRAS